MLELQKVTVQYGGFTAVEDITFEVPAGQFVAVVGPTGCGKSSLLNLVAGLLAPAQGSVRTGARPVNAVNRDCGYMFQVDALLPWKTALDNVLLGPILRGTSRTEARSLARQWLDGPTNVLETLKAADTQTDWSKVDLSKTFTNSFVEAVK